ncbi:MAG TPA: hypothetical protein VEL31_32025 [Ktedonobacteraceae bacterium]|nr:hypothetical protein [Ktedonobacteraceae bacterium]
MPLWMDILLGMVAFLALLKGIGFLLRLWAEFRLRGVVKQLRRQRSGKDGQS